MDSHVLVPPGSICVAEAVSRDLLPDARTQFRSEVAMTSPSVQYYIFVKPYTIGGTTINPGVLLRGEFKVTDTHISQNGSNFLSDIPIEYLEPYTPYTPNKRTRKK